MEGYGGDEVVYDEDVVVYDNPTPVPGTIPEGGLDDLVYSTDDSDPDSGKPTGSTRAFRKMVESDKKKIGETMELEYDFMGPRLEEKWLVRISRNTGEPYFVNRITGDSQLERPTRDLHGRPQAPPPPVKLSLKPPSRDSTARAAFVTHRSKFNNKPPPDMIRPISEHSHFPTPDVIQGDLPTNVGGVRYPSNSSSG